MKTVKKARVRVIERASADEFETALNEVLSGATDPDITFDTNRPFLCYVRFTEYEDIPESVRDAYELRGEYHYCAECRYFKPSADKRVKHVYCGLGNRCTADKCACEVFYKELADS